MPLTCAPPTTTLHNLPLRMGLTFFIVIGGKAFFRGVLGDSSSAEISSKSLEIVSDCVRDGLMLGWRARSGGIC